MNPQPIAFAMPELQRLDDGRLRFFRRMADGILADCKVGDLLWIREPYFLPTEHDHQRPTLALASGATPTFQSDVGYVTRLRGHGVLRVGRFLCREWHRRHLRITRVDRQRIRDVTGTETALSGYRSRNHFADAWNCGVSMRGRSAKWDANPEVLRFEFDLIASPLPENATPQRTRPRDWQPQAEQLDLRERTLLAFGSTVTEAFSQSQVERVVRIRDAVAWVLRETWPGLTYDQLGVLLQGKDHTVARIMVGRAYKRRGTDAAFRLITDDLTLGHRPTEEKPLARRSPTSRPTADNPLVHLPGVTKSPALQPPAGRQWCEQCEQLADHTRAAACASPFCKVKPKELERA